MILYRYFTNIWQIFPHEDTTECAEIPAKNGSRSCAVAAGPEKIDDDDRREGKDAAWQRQTRAFSGEYFTESSVDLRSDAGQVGKHSQKAPTAYRPGLNA